MGEEVSARVIKIDRADRRIGLSIKAANYSQEQLKEEEAVLDSLKPGEDLVALQHAFDTLGDEDAEGVRLPKPPPRRRQPRHRSRRHLLSCPSEEEAPAAEEAPAEDGKLHPRNKPNSIPFDGQDFPARFCDQALGQAVESRLSAGEPP